MKSSRPRIVKELDKFRRELTDAYEGNAYRNVRLKAADDYMRIRHPSFPRNGRAIRDSNRIIKRIISGG